MMNVYFSCYCGDEGKRVATATFDRTSLNLIKKPFLSSGNYFSFFSAAQNQMNFSSASGKQIIFFFCPSKIRSVSFFLIPCREKSGARVTKEGFLRKSIVAVAFFMIKDIHEVAFMRRPPLAQC
jgi:hypothetical protein